MRINNETKSEWYPCVSVRHVLIAADRSVVKLPPAGSYMLPLRDPESYPRGAQPQRAHIHTLGGESGAATHPESAGCMIACMM